MTQTRGDQPGPVLTVIIPVFNEAATLEDLLEQVLRAPFDMQVLIVDDGSTDETPALIERLEATYAIEVLRHLENRGKGTAIRTALPHAAGRFTIIQDGDLELCPADYSRLMEPLVRGEADCVMGSRFVCSRTCSLGHLGVVLLNGCVRMLYGIRLTDEACCYKVFPTATLRTMDLECQRFEFCPEVVAKACRLGLRIKEVPVSYQPRSVSDGKKLRYRDGIEALRTLWRWRHWVPQVNANEPGQQVERSARRNGVTSGRLPHGPHGNVSEAS